MKFVSQLMLGSGIAFLFALQPLACAVATPDNTGGTENSSGDTNPSTENSSGDPTGTSGDSSGDEDPVDDVDEDRFSVSVKLASDVNSQAPGTIGIVEWSVSAGVVEEAYVEFGLDTTYGMVAPVDIDEPDFRTLLLGMKPNRDYHFRVVATIDATTYASGDYQLATGPATNLVTLKKFDVANESERERGFIITELYQSELGGIVFIIDPDGEIVWWFESEIESLDRARMSADGKNMWMIPSGLKGGLLERVTMDTLDAESYDVGASHDLTPVEGETMAYLDYSESDCDSIYTIDPSGKTTEIFESEGVMDDKECHSNALRYSAAEKVYTFSDHKLDILWVDLNGNVKQQLTDIVGSSNTWGGTQHGHHLLNDSMVLFANDGGTSRGPAVIEYDLDDGTEIWRHEYEEDITVKNLGDVQRLPGGNTLVTFSTAGIIEEVDANGDVVLTIKTDFSVGYTMWRESLYGLPPDILQ